MSNITFLKIKEFKGRAVYHLDIAIQKKQLLKEADYKDPVEV